MKKIFLLVALLTVASLGTVNAPGSKTGKGGFNSPTTTKGDIIVRNTTIDTRLPIGADGLALIADSSKAEGMAWTAVAGTGDVVGPASSTDNALTRFDGTTGKAVQNSGTTLSDAGIMALPSGGGISINGTADAGNIFNSRRDRNGGVRLLVSNQDAGASAYVRLSGSTDAGDLNLDVNSLAAGASVNLSADSTFTGGLGVSMGGTNPIILRTNGVDRINVGGTGTTTVNGNLIASSSSGPMLVAKDTGTGGSDADPQLELQDTAGAVGRFGFLTAAGTYLTIQNLLAGGLTFATNGSTVAEVTTVGAWDIGTPGNDDRVMLNSDALKFTGSTSTTQFIINDGAGSTGSLKLLGGATGNAGGVAFYGASHATKASITEFYNTGAVVGTISAAGKFQIGETGGTQTHDVIGDVTISGTTASKILATNGSKKLVSSTMSQTTLEALTGEQIDGLIVAPEATTYILRLNAKYAGVINNISIKTSAGTVTAKLQIDGVDVTDCTGIAVTSTEATTTCTAANAVGAGTTIQMVLSSLSSAANLAFSVGMTRN